MKDIYLTNYAVKGIKTLDQLISLSFYRKIIPRNPQTQEYNIKGIYGMNGSGKSGIIASVDILKNLLTNPNYLNNPLIQKNLDAIINKKTNELFMETTYLTETGNTLFVFRYELTLAKDLIGKYIITSEQLSSRKASSQNSSMKPVFKVVNGEIAFLQQDNSQELENFIFKKTTNLLSTTPLCTLFFEKILSNKDVNFSTSELFFNICTLYILGNKIHVFIDQSDDHRKYFINNLLNYEDDPEKKMAPFNDLIKHLLETDSDRLNIISVSENVVPKNSYHLFEETINKLYEFLRIFKTDLLKIKIDRKEDADVYVCNLIMVYESYQIHAEFESTGIKKLIKLYAYLKEMVHGGIVFIDEFDSNLHDVYLCALLEFLMEHGKGQLCFTTHNVGPMDILKQHKKSIDFLSLDHKIYPWTTNGHYSPSKLYRNGMIEGSPFNVDSIDFIGVFSLTEEDE